MRLDRLHRQRELPGDLLVRVATGNEAQHLTLARRQLIELLVDPHTARAHGERVEHEAGQARREHGIAGRDPLDGVGEFWAADRLGHIAAGTGTDDGDHVVRRVGHREGQEADVGMTGQHAADHRLAAPARHVYVDEHDVGQPLADHLDRRLDLRSVTDHIDMRGQFSLHPDAEDVVIVDEEHPYALAHIISHG